MLERIFELYTQEERALKKSNSGLGIGLALVSQIISLHGGSVKAESAGEGQGSAFTVRLPFADVNPPDDRVPSEPPRSGTKRVLIVDDNEDSANSMAMLLDLYGYETRVSYNFRSAMDEAASFLPHVALLDLSVPEPNGIELAMEFRKMDETRETLLIAWSGYGQREVIERTKKAGISHHIVKPSDIDTIRNLIDQSTSST